MSISVLAPQPLPEALTAASRAGRTLVMAVLNVTPDSFSDGGRWLAVDRALARARQMWDEGADIIDVGGESTRPGAQAVSVSEELARVEPVVRTLVAEGMVVSVDTVHADTARAVIEAGAHIVNDVSGGLADAAMHDLIAQTGVVYVCQHWRGSPETMDGLTDYGGDVVGVVEAELGQRLEELERAGVARSQVVIDPGLGFAKTHPQSWQLLAATSRLSADMGLPVLVGASRKRFLAASVDPRRGADPLARDAATAAASALAAAGGAWAVRVHEVVPNRDAVVTASLWKEAR